MAARGARLAVALGLVAALAAPSAALAEDPIAGPAAVCRRSSSPTVTGPAPRRSGRSRGPHPRQVPARRDVRRQGPRAVRRPRPAAAPLRPRARPRARRHGPPGQGRHRAPRAPAGRRVRGGRPGHRGLADAERSRPAPAVGPRPGERRRHRRQDRLEHDHGRSGRGRRGHRLRHAAHPPATSRPTSGRTRARSRATASTTRTTATSTTSTAGTSWATTTSPTTSSGTGRTSPGRSRRWATTGSASPAWRTRPDPAAAHPRRQRPGLRVRRDPRHRLRDPPRRAGLQQQLGLLGRDLAAAVRRAPRGGRRGPAGGRGVRQRLRRHRRDPELPGGLRPAQHPLGRRDDAGRRPRRVLELRRGQRRHRGPGRAHPEHAAGRLRVLRRDVDGEPARRRRRRAAAGRAPGLDRRPGPCPDPRHRPADPEPQGHGRDRRHGQRRGGPRARRPTSPRR